MDVSEAASPGDRKFIIRKVYDKKIVMIVKAPGYKSYYKIEKLEKFIIR